MSIDRQEDDLSEEEPNTLTRHAIELMYGARQDMVTLKVQYEAAAELDSAAFEDLELAMLTEEAMPAIYAGGSELVELLVGDRGEDVNTLNAGTMLNLRRLALRRDIHRERWNRSLSEAFQGHLIGATALGENRIAIWDGGKRTLAGPDNPTEIDDQPFLGFDAERGVLWVGRQHLRYGILMWQADGEPAARIDVYD